MKKYQKTLRPLLALALVCGLGITSNTRAQESRQSAAAPPAATDSHAKTQAQTQPQIEQEKKRAQDQANQTLDKEAVEAIRDTHNAIKAIKEQKNQEAIAAIERATGKLEILTARNPKAALLPVDAEVEVIDTALLDLNAIRDRVKAAEDAFDDKDYPRARLLLEGLVSEIRVRTHHLPLATYPAAMKNAARLLEEKKYQEAGAMLEVALNTLVVVDRVTPLPLALAQNAINEAQAKRQTNKDEAQKLLAYAKFELERAKELGYAGKDAEYASLNQTISNLERQVKGNENTDSAFARLKERVSAFFQKQSQSEKSEKRFARR